MKLPSAAVAVPPFSQGVQAHSLPCTEILSVPGRGLNRDTTGGRGPEANSHEEGYIGCIQDTLMGKEKDPSFPQAKLVFLGSQRYAASLNPRAHKSKLLTNVLCLGSLVFPVSLPLSLTVLPRVTSQINTLHQILVSNLQ